MCMPPRSRSERLIWSGVQSAEAVFDGKKPDKPDIDVQRLHAKIGELALENDFLESALIKAGKLSARK